MAGKLTFTLADYEKSARTYRRQLLKLPIIGIQSTTKYMTVRPGITYSEVVGEASVNAQLAPYRAGERSDANLNLVQRELRTYFGSVNADFEPNAAISTLLGHRASQAMGDAQKSTIQAHEVLGLIAKSVSKHLNDAVWSAKRDPAGKTTATLFDGFDTITTQEIAAGGIAADKKNLVELDEAITKTNAVDMLKEIMFNADPLLRAEECFVFVPQAVADAYNENYLMSHSGLVYNTSYNQVEIEGSNRLWTLVPLANKAGSEFIHIAPKSNMLIGVDQMSDLENVRVKEYAPDVLTFMMRMFFGAQFETIDARRLLVAKLAV